MGSSAAVMARRRWPRLWPAALWATLFLALSSLLPPGAQAQELRQAAPHALPQAPVPSKPPEAARAAPRVAPTRFDITVDAAQRQTFIEENERRMSEKRREMLRAVDEILAQAGPRYAARTERLFQKAELEWEEARYQYLLRRHQYERALEKAGATPPPEPRPDYSACIATYRRILADDQAYARADQVRFHLGHALIQSEQTREAVEVMHDLLRLHPKSRYAPDSLLLMGEMWFDRAKLAAARESYDRLLREYPGTMAAAYGRYKLAWVLFNQRDFRGTVRELEQLVAEVREGPSGGLGLRQQALSDLVVAFAELGGGQEEAIAYYRSVGGEPLARTMMEKLAHYLDSQDKNEDTLRVLAWLVAQDPEARQLPAYHRFELEVLKRVGKIPRIEAALARILPLYAPGSRWSQRFQGDAVALATARELSEEGLEIVASYYHQEGQRLHGGRESEAMYGKAAARYAEFLERFPDGKRAGKVRFFLAETLARAGQLEAAAARYREVVARGPAELAEEAAYKAVYWLSELMKRQGLDPELAELPAAAGSGGGAGGTGGGAASGGGRLAQRKIQASPLGGVEQKFVAAADDFVARFPRSADAPAVAYKAGKVHYLHGDFAAAARRFITLFEGYPQHAYAVAAGDLILDCYNRSSDWPEVVKWARRLLKEWGTRPRSPRQQAEAQALREVVAGASIKAAEVLAQRRDFAGASLAMLAIAEELPQADNAPLAMFNAAALLERAEKAEEAIRLYERLRQTYARSDFARRASLVLAAIHESRAEFAEAAADYERAAVVGAAAAEVADALWNAAVLRETVGDAAQAAALFQRYSRTYPERADAAQALLRAGRQLERLGKPEQAVTLYEECAQRTQASSAARAVEALTRAGLAVQASDPARAQKLFGRAVDIFHKSGQSAGSAAAVFAAQARFQHGEMAFADFERVRFELPESLLQRRAREKLRRLEVAVRAYLEVAALRSPEWTAAAAFRIGLGYQRLAESFLEAPVPTSLKQEDRELYRARLQEQAQPIEQKAQDAYQHAVRLAHESGVYNRWTALAARQLAHYRPEEFPVAEEQVVRPSFVGGALP